MDADFNIVARPFPKFFNLGEFENQVIPNEPFEVFEKMDGSLGILYWLENKPHIATRGSFVSDQSQVATEMLHTQYAEIIPVLDKSKTYLFEIIYPENRIVVNYGNKRQLVLLAIIDTETGVETLPATSKNAEIDRFQISPATSKNAEEKEFNDGQTLRVMSKNDGINVFQTLQATSLPVVKRYDGLNDLTKLKQLEEENREGFVVKFKSGYRLKIKFDEYQRIHRIITQVSTLNIWEYLKEGQDLLPILDRVPDEFYDWVKLTHANLLKKYAEIEVQSKNDFKVLVTRKETALYFQTCQSPSVLFKMLDEQNYDQVIWKMIKPDYQKPFADKSDDLY